MLGLMRACAGRAGVGAWRSRRQVIWLVCVAAAVFIVYVQFSPDSQNNVEESDHHHRALNTLFKDDGKGKETGQVQRVKFVNGDREVTDPNVKSQKWNDEPTKNELEPIPIANNVIDLDQNALNLNNDINSNTESKPKVIPQIEQHQQPPAPVGAVVVPQNQEEMMNMGGPWSGAYKYNVYGEPVYGHTNRPNYIPKHRVIHLDLKGGPPKFQVYKWFLPWIARYGATAVILEYEDMFPFKGRLAPIAAKNHYTPQQIKDIVHICRENNLEVIPLVQTFGHLELALKLEPFSHLREIPEIPQAICPSLNESLWLVRTMVDQMMELHQGVKYLHIGCDEVFHMGECERCRLVNRESLFLNHVAKVARHARDVHKVIPIVWDDMLRHVSVSAMKEINLGELVEPMVWVYAEDIYRFVQPSIWNKFGQVFPYVWAASAFKGAFKEQLTVPNVRRHLDNNLNWLDVMAAEHAKFTGGFRGLVLTGWQRFDHFAVVCELLPTAMPSIAVNLITVSHGYFNTSLQTQLYKALDCMQTPKYQSWINLDNDPFLWDKFSWCFFPGSAAFKLTARLDATKRDVDAYIEKISRSRAWITEYNRRHNFSSPMRVDEDLEELPARLHSVTQLVKTARDALGEWFDEWTVGEWIELHIWPLLNSLQTIQKESESMKLVKHWPARPLPLLPQLLAFGISEPVEQQKTSQTSNRSRPPGIDDGT